MNNGILHLNKLRNVCVGYSAGSILLEVPITLYENGNGFIPYNVGCLVQYAITSYLDKKGWPFYLYIAVDKIAKEEDDFLLHI